MTFLVYVKEENEVLKLLSKFSVTINIATAVNQETLFEEKVSWRFRPIGRQKMTQHELTVNR